MKNIDVTSSISTGLISTLRNATAIHVEDVPIGQGGFGIAYRVADIDGRPVPSQVVKLLFDNGHGSARRGIETIRELQARLLHEHIALVGAGSTLLQTYPALQGVPQLSFEGRFEGRAVVGYCANNLVTLGYQDFAKVLDDSASNRVFQSLSMDTKLRLAGQLADGFHFLSSKIRFIHADIKAEALFVDACAGRCAIIDFDSGALSRGVGDTPTTFGTKQDWLAPEILDQLDAPANAQRLVKVDLLSDVWSVNVAIHYFLTGVHPLFFLTELSDRSLDAYFKTFQWPSVDAGFPFFRKEYSAAYRAYARFMNARVPADVRARLAYTINRGYRDPTSRTNLGQWRTVLQTANQPAIKRFTSDRSVVGDTQPVQLSWEVTGASRLELIGHGDVTNRSRVDVIVTHNTTFELVLTTDAGTRIVRHASVTVDRRPARILGLSTDRSVVEATRPARLTWQVAGASRVEIDHGIGDVTNQSGVEVLPIVDTTYTLTAINGFGDRVTQTVGIHVSRRAPEIRAFDADRRMLTDARPVAISWEVSCDAHEVVLTGVGVVPNVGSAAVHQRRKTEYVLTARSLFGFSTTQRIIVDVASTPPVIRSFDARPTLLATSSSAIVEWSVDGAATVVLEPLGVHVSLRGTRQLQVATTTVFVLRAESYFGAIAERTAEVVVLQRSPTPMRTPRPTASALPTPPPGPQPIAASRTLALSRSAAPSPVNLHIPRG